MSVQFEVAGTVNDGLERTDWFDGDTCPTVVGEYEAVTGGGHVFRRKWDGAGWVNTVNNLPTTVKMPWRGLVPGSLSLERYALYTRMQLKGNAAPTMHELAIAVLNS